MESACTAATRTSTSGSDNAFPSEGIASLERADVRARAAMRRTWGEGSWSAPAIARALSGLPARPASVMASARSDGSGEDRWSMASSARASELVRSRVVTSSSLRLSGHRRMACQATPRSRSGSEDRCLMAARHTRSS